MISGDVFWPTYNHPLVCDSGDCSPEFNISLSKGRVHVVVLYELRRTVVGMKYCIQNSMSIVGARFFLYLSERNLCLKNYLPMF